MRIAIVEDEKEFAKQLMNDLDRYGKESGVAMDVRWFTDGAQIVGDYRPEWDLILLDFLLGSMLLKLVIILLVLQNKILRLLLSN